LWEKFPPRPVPAVWEATRQDRATVLRRLLAAPFTVENSSSRSWRKFALIKVLDWLEGQPGQTWQQRWDASGVGVDGRIDWRPCALDGLKNTGKLAEDGARVGRVLGLGLTALVCGDVLRPSGRWLLGTISARHLSDEMARVRDVKGFAALTAVANASVVGYCTTRAALERIAIIMAAKGGSVHDITLGDSLELLDACDQLFDDSSGGNGPFFYQLLHATGVFPADAPPTVRMFTPRFQGQLTIEQLVDRYDLACRPVRDLLVDYLRERQPAVDYKTVTGLATALALWFWKDLENHHPGIDSLRLAPDIATAWKQRIKTRTLRSTSALGDVVETKIARAGAPNALMTVRAFYLDLSQWAADDPARWGPWVVPCPIRVDDIQHKKERSARKSRMDQRTRERLPSLPVLVAAVDQARKAAATRLQAAAASQPGELFTAGGEQLRRSRLTKPTPRIWAEDPDTGKRTDLTREEDNSFWAWAAIEVLRGTGVRIEELTELSHHSLVQYRLPTSGELVPLLQIAPSKTDTERLLVISPELADVLSTIICRIRNPDGSVPLVVAYDAHECVWNPPMPLLFQRIIGLEKRPITIDVTRTLIHNALTNTGLTDASGKPLIFLPHDFRRVFTTDAVMNGMPPRIAQLILGHKDINTTMGYKAVYPEEAINGHRAFIARRRELRPSEEYRTPTDEEWEEFLGHFERRKVALGDCGRAYGTACVHEHSCVRCPLLRIEPAQRPRLVDIRDNLVARVEEALRERWIGEAEGLKVSLAAANAKLAQLDGLTARRNAAVSLGMPAFPAAAGRTITTPITLAPASEETT
jgi:integrase